MMSEAFDPASAAGWLAHGRKPDHAVILANVWRDFPDLPSHASPAARMERMRERARALRPVMEGMSRAADDERQARNFAFTKERAARGAGDERDRAILRARTEHGFDWDRAVRYASGWYAARAGWEPEARGLRSADAMTDAYDLGFRDGGGNRDDLFDAARRAFAASAPGISLQLTVAARPRPSTWSKPTDAPRPCRWHRRLLILGAPEAGLVAPLPEAYSADLTALLEAEPDAAKAIGIVIGPAGFVALCDARPSPPILPAGGPVHDQALQALLCHREIDEILVAAQGPYLDFLDAHASALPLCRTMERTRNTVLQQKTHFRIWLDRGLSVGETLAGGHIRWGKAINGLTGRLGEFTARYGGKVSGQGHRITIETAQEGPARGFVSADGEPLAWETYISNRARLRTAMATRLRAFGAATRLATFASMSAGTPNPE